MPARTKTSPGTQFLAAFELIIFEQKGCRCDKFYTGSKRSYICRAFSGRFFCQNRQANRGGPITMIISNLPAIDWSIEGKGLTFLLIIWQLIIYSIDIEWIMSKESIDGSLDHTCTSTRGNIGKRILHPAFRFKSPPDVYFLRCARAGHTAH